MCKCTCGKCTHNKDDITSSTSHIIIKVVILLQIEQECKFSPLKSDTDLDPPGKSNQSRHASSSAIQQTAKRKETQQPTVRTYMYIFCELSAFVFHLFHVTGDNHALKSCCQQVKRLLSRSLLQNNIHNMLHKSITIIIIKHPSSIIILLSLLLLNRTVFISVFFVYSNSGSSTNLHPPFFCFLAFDYIVVCE